MRIFWIKVLLFLAAWYEVTVELGLSGSTALVVTLLACGGAMMLLRLPGQIISALGPRAVVALGPLAVWAGLVYWLSPRVLTAYPVLSLIAAATLTMLGAGARYVTTRFPNRSARRVPLLRGAVVPLILLVSGAVYSQLIDPLTLGVYFVLMGLPVRLGWRFIPPASPHKFDARMGDAKGFRGAGFRENS